MATVSTESAATLNSRPMVGRATFTMVVSMMFMNMAATKTTLTATFWFISRRGKTAPGG